MGSDSGTNQAARALKRAVQATKRVANRADRVIECSYVNDPPKSDWPKADQRYKDDVAQTTRSDRLSHRNDD